MKQKLTFFASGVLFYFTLIIYFLHLQNRLLNEVFINSARSMFSRDVAIRRFVSRLNGVYADTEKIQPNPYLNINNREIVANNKKTYTLINPSYFIRNVYNIMIKDFKIKSKITSLKLKNPEKRSK